MQKERFCLSARESFEMPEMKLCKRSQRKAVQTLTQQVVIRFSLVFEGQAAVRHVVQVLEPLEERHGYTAGVDVQVRDDQNVAVDENLVGGWRGRAVRGFGDDLTADFASIVAGDDFLNSGWHEDVALLEHQVLALVGLKKVLKLF